MPWTSQEGDYLNIAIAFLLVIYLRISGKDNPNRERITSGILLAMLLFNSNVSFLERLQGKPVWRYALLSVAIVAFIDAIARTTFFTSLPAGPLRSSSLAITNWITRLFDRLRPAWILPSTFTIIILIAIALVFASATAVSDLPIRGPTIPAPPPALPSPTPALPERLFEKAYALCKNDDIANTVENFHFKLRINEFGFGSPIFSVSYDDLLRCSCVCTKVDLCKAMSFKKGERCYLFGTTTTVGRDGWRTGIRP